MYTFYVTTSPVEMKLKLIRNQQNKTKQTDNSTKVVINLINMTYK